MCASASFSIYIGLFFLMFPPAHERDAIPLLIVSSCLSFVIAASGADWVQSLKIADIEETSGRFALRCFFMVAGPVVDFLVFGILLIVYSMCVAVIGLIGVSILGTGEIWIPVLLFGFLGLLYVGRAGLHIRNSVMDTYGQIF
ncbi:MAG: hypothetical protein QF886_03395 [Planctomycetota bacterium]|nr:hypothetical protein [Planctomycetota bacterium]